MFRDPAAEQVQPTVQERLEHYRPVVMAAVSEDTAYRNACGCLLYTSKKGFFCERSDCKFGLWRDNKFLTAKRITLDKQMVAALLERGRVRVDDVYSEKTGKRFSTDLLLEDDGVRSSYWFDFGKEGTK